MLPAIATRADFHRVRRQPIDAWLPALRTLVARHGLPEEPIELFASGQSPVFALGKQFVVKLVPNLWARFAEREVECLRYLADNTTLPVSRVVAEGRMEDWSYLVSTRLPGRQLDHVWPRLNPEEKGNLARDLGGLIRDLHRIPAGGLRPGGIVWTEFCEKVVAAWSARRDVERLPAPLREDAPRFLAQKDFWDAATPLVLLHGDLAPENTLVDHGTDGWRISGVLDFGNAFVGDPLFDFTAPTVLLAPGRAEIVDRILAGYGGSAALEAHVLRRRLMALTLIHPLADLPDCLALLPGAEACQTWEAVAKRFWPG